MKTLPTVTFIITKKAIMQFAEQSGPCTGLCAGGRDNKITYPPLPLPPVSPATDFGPVCSYLS